MHKRLFPAYTDAQLEAIVASGEASSPETLAKIVGELEARKAGISKPFATPQADWSSVTISRPRIDR